MSPVGADPHRNACRLRSLTTSSTLSGPPMLPGLMRTAATPPSIAFRASEALKWMSATTAEGDRRTSLGSASASSVFGTATRTTSQPAEASAAICAVVASTSSSSSASSTARRRAPRRRSPRRHQDLTLAGHPGRRRGGRRSSSGRRGGGGARQQCPRRGRVVEVRSDRVAADSAERPPNALTRRRAGAASSKVGGPATADEHQHSEVPTPSPAERQEQEAGQANADRAGGILLTPPSS